VRIRIELGGTGISTSDNFSYRSNFRFRSSFRFRSRFRSNFRSSFSFSFSFSFRSRSSSSSTTSGDIFYCSGSRQLNHSSLYLLLIDVGPIDYIAVKIVSFNEITVTLWCCVIEYGITLKVSKFKYKIRYNFIGSTLIFSFCTYFKLPLFLH